MLFGFASLLMLLAGGMIAVDGARHEAIGALRAEFVGGGLLATGLLMIGMGLPSSLLVPG